jgi:hypothetical protein
VEQLNKWIGIQDQKSLVGRHESNGVEGLNKHIIRHLRTLVSDERVMYQWSLPSVLRTVEYVLNDTVNSETGTSAFLLRFGNDVETYMKLPSQLPPAEFTSKYVKLLDENLKLVRDISKTYHDELVRERTRENDEARQNRYCEGDMVLYVPSRENNPIGSSNKLLPTNKGPYEVISHEGNNVKCRHMSEHEEKEFH